MRWLGCEPVRLRIYGGCVNLSTVWCSSKRVRVVVYRGVATARRLVSVIRQMVCGTNRFFDHERVLLCLYHEEFLYLLKVGRN